MRHLCLPLFLVIISGVSTQTADEVRDVPGFEGDDVLLPCTCMNRDLNKVFKWQTENPATMIFRVESTEESYGENYTTRVEIFVNESSSNCSILLKKITKDDEKTYTCRFNNGVHKVHAVNLKVTQRPATRLTDQVSDGPSKLYFTIIPVIALLLIVGYLGNIYLKQRRKCRAPNQGDTPLSSEDNV
ncbi:uncharacterized protein LOC105925049 isoform X2 [Fundulus heteroclitus]|uniref:uncharacterized protein LOC105925049 isoform X2 n=1 Tax=Fundulus heteroclitus TaxID=8078 RepID=UPI00165B01E3|nr:uncharacterized protein LOC105925049 isoform X2 [Fundulus heteroclitus]